MIVEPQTAFRATLDRLSLPAIILLMAMPGVSAQTTAPSELHGNYIRTRFGMEQGLYSNQVDDIVQSGDGLLFLRVDETWISHFDGQHFDVDQPGKLGRVSTLEIAPNGDLWVGRLGDLIQVRADNLSQLGDWPVARYQLGPDYIPIVLRFTHDGVLWVGTNHGLYRFDHGKLLLAIPGSEIERIEEEGNGRLWITTKADVMEVDGAHVLPHPELASLLGVSAGEIFHVFEDSHGVTWFCTRKGVARRVGRTIEKLQPWGSRGGEAFRIYEDPRGRIWFAKGEGLFQLTTKGLELVGPGMNVRQMRGDRDGSLWVSTNGDGLYRFKDSTARTYTTADGLPSNIVMTVLASRDESIWAGFNCGGIAHLVGREFRIYNEKDGLLNSCVWSLAEDASHDLWIGTWGGGVFRFHQGKFIQYSTAQGLPDDVVRSVITARDGSVWLALRTGVSRIRDGRVRNYTKADGLSSSSYVKVHEDRTGGIWAESRSKLERLVGDRFEQFSPQGNRDQLYLTGEDATGAMYFTALSPGGEVATYRFANNEMIQVPFGLDARASSMPFQELSQLIWEMRETNGGDIWTFSSRIARFRQGSLKRAHGKDDPLDFETFGSSDGLPMTQPSSGSPISAHTPDGKLWVATNKGLIVLDLFRIQGTENKPTIYIQGITVGRNPQSPSRGLVLPAGTHHLELNFNAIELTAPEKIRLQYRLDGADSEWLDTTPPGHAVYTALSPGTHAFHIRACNRSGIWDRAGVVYFITQQPYFYQTRWFLIACIAFGLIVITGLYRMRMRHVVARVNMRFEERVAERTRIARDLHDTLLQSFNALLLRLQTVSNVLPSQPDEAKRRIEGAIEQASHAIVEGRDAVHEMRSTASATIDLDRAISDFARELLSSSALDSAPEVQVHVEGAPKPLNPIVRDEVYRIVTEAIRNAIRHANARQIEVEIRYDKHHLRFRIGDNGKGLDPGLLDGHHKAGHWGLRGMRERAKLIGGSLDIWSHLGTGTEIELKIPAATGYARARSSRPSVLSLFRRN